MLSDAAIDRYSRQILLPEVGGRGQERLCATTVIVRGDGAAAKFAGTLLSSAGVRVVAEADASGRLVIACGDVRIVGGLQGPRAAVATLVGRPCADCAASSIRPEPCTAVEHAQVVGALLATETLRAALGLATGGRVHTIDFADGTFEAHPVPPTEGCPSCAPRSPA